MTRTPEQVRVDAERTTAIRRHLCHLLDLDPSEVTNLTIEVGSRGAALLQWEGARRIPIADLARVLATLNESPTP